MVALLGGLVVFALMAVIVLNMLAGDESPDASVGAGLLLWAACLVHADTVLDAAYLDVARVPVPRGLALGLAVVVGVAGFTLFGWATRTLVRDGQFDGLRAERLVRTGPYTLMRHPQHAGWATMLLAVAIAGRSLVGLALVGVFVLFVSRLARIEDRDLRARFGSAFDDWRAATPAVFTGRRRIASA